jgi:DnaJ-class molecular chaperone
MDDFQSIFEDLFGGAMGGGGRKSRRGGNAAVDEYSEDITLKYDIDFNESVNGATKVTMRILR